MTALQDAALTIVKEADVAIYSEVGDVINYTITATNAGNVTLTNVTVSDPDLEPPALDCTPALPVAELVPGESVVCAGSYAITQQDLDNGSFTNTATADSDETEPVQASVTVDGDVDPEQPDIDLIPIPTMQTAGYLLLTLLLLLIGGMALRQHRIG